jgi:hypothetical protein
LANEDQWVQTWCKKGDHKQFAIHEPSNRITILGGMNSSQVEYTEDALTFHPLPDLPTKDPVHCAALLDGGDMFVLGEKCCFLYENEKSEWKRCPDAEQQISIWDRGSIGVVKTEGGEVEIVLA